jgi:hypothetical protein
VYSTRGEEIFAPLNIIDLSSFLPTILFLLFPSSTSLFSSGGLSFLRLLRILRLQRFVSDFETFKEVRMAKIEAALRAGRTLARRQGIDEQTWH